MSGSRKFFYISKDFCATDDICHLDIKNALLQIKKLFFAYRY